MTSPIQTLFVDRDGVVNRMRRDYVKSWDELELLPGAIESLAIASQRGLDVIVLSNQSAIGRGLVSRDVVDQIHHRLAAMVTAGGGRIQAFLVCPHRPEDACDCRKPAPGLFFRAHDELGVDLSRAVMIGDQPSDSEAAHAAGCAAVVVEEGGLREIVDLIIGLEAVEEAIILCGGLGTRLQGVLGSQPKSLAIVHDRPFVEWLLLALSTRGLQRAILAAGYGVGAIRNYFRDGKPVGLEITISEEPGPLGTGGAARLAAQQAHTSPLLVMNGDSYSRFNLIELLLMHQRHHAKATLWLQNTDRADRFGSVVVNPDGKVKAFQEKQEGSGLISAGVYLVNRDVLCQIRADRMVSLEREVFPSLVREGLYGVVGDGPFIDIGTPESLASAAKVLDQELSTLERTA